MSKPLGNLRYQIALILLLAIIPLSLLAVYLAVDEGREDASRARADSQATVRLVSQDLNLVIQSGIDVVRGLSRNPVIRNRPESCNAQLAALKPAFPQFANMIVFDTDYNVLCAASNRLHVRTFPKTPDNLALTDRVRRSRQVGVGSFALTAPGKRELPLAGPVIDDDGEVRSFLFVTVDLDWLDKEVDSIAVPKEAVLLVMDGRGTELARNPRSREWPAGTPAPQFERTLVGKGDFDNEVQGEGGIRRFYSVAKVRDGEDLLVVMKTRSWEIYRPARRRLAWHLSGLVSAGLLLLGLTWLGSDRFFINPLSGLIRTADRLAAGSLEARAGLKYSGEIGVLAQSFDRMADTVERERVKTLRTSQTFRSIIEGTSALTGEDFFRALVRSLTGALEADFALVGELTPDSESVNTLAVCADGKIVENLVYPLRGTPCENVAKANACYYETGIQELFPEDTMLRDLGMHSYLAAPLLDEAGKTLGLIAVLHRHPIANNITDPLSMLRIFAARASAELTRLHAERALRRSVAEREIVASRNEEMVHTLQALTARLQSVREEEGSRIAREIHDQLGQQLTAMRFSVALIGRRNGQVQASATGEPGALPGNGLSDLTGMIDAMIVDVRRIATELRPAILDTFGLNAAIEWLADDFQKQTNISCVFEGMDDIAVDRDLSIAVFRICQESLTNIARHSQASEARVRLDAGEEWLSLEVSDNGKGISQEMLMSTRSLGVVGMRERARMAGGEFIIGTGRRGNGPACGTSITARFPLRPHSGAEGSGPEQGMGG